MVAAYRAGQAVVQNVFAKFGEFSRGSNSAAGGGTRPTGFWGGGSGGVLALRRGCVAAWVPYGYLMSSLLVAYR
jgi:hypothetical protein